MSARCESPIPRCPALATPCSSRRPGSILMRSSLLSREQQAAANDLESRRTGTHRSDPVSTLSISLGTGGLRQRLHTSSLEDRGAGKLREASVDLRLVDCAYDEEANEKLARDVLAKAVEVRLDEAEAQVVVEHAELLVWWPSDPTCLDIVLWVTTLPFKLLIALTVPSPLDYSSTYRW